MTRHQPSLIKIKGPIGINRHFSLPTPLVIPKPKHVLRVMREAFFDPDVAVPVVHSHWYRCSSPFSKFHFKFIGCSRGH